MKIALLALMVAAGLSGQVPESFTAGALQCGAARLNTNQVHTWCYVKASNTLVHNSLNSVPISVITSFNYPAIAPNYDTITWQFKWDGKVMRYESAINNSVGKSGRLY